MNHVTTSPDATRTVRVVGWGEADFDAAQQGVSRLSALALPGVLAPARVALRPDGAVVVDEHVGEAATLESVLAVRGSLSAGECVWWAIGVAEALAGLHCVGLCHGAIDAQGVWIGNDQVVLGGVDVVRLPREPGDGAGDVAALGALLAASVKQEDAARVGAWTEPMTDPRPEARPTAAMAARALASCAHPEPIRLYPVGIAAALRKAAGASHAPSPTSVPSRDETELLPEARWWRAQQRVRRAATSRGALVGAAVAAGLAVVALATWGVVAVMEPAADARVAVGQGLAPEDRPDVGATMLAEQRIAALADGDGAALMALTAEGGEARHEAEATAQRLESGTVAFEGLEAAVVSVEVLEAPVGRPRQGDEAIVRVALAVEAYSAIADGVSTSVGASGEVSELVLEYDEASGWLVVSAS